jgi:hypothetical protein
MPTEREQDKLKPELKHDNNPSTRLRFLNQIETSMYNFQPLPFTIKSIVLLLALYGLYKIIFPS